MTTAAELPIGSVVAGANTVYIKDVRGGWSSTGTRIGHLGYSDAEWIDHLIQSGEATILRVGDGT